MGLSKDSIDSILSCVQAYLCGNICIEDENIRRDVDEDQYMNKDLIDFASNRYSLKAKKKFLCNGPGFRGSNVARLACHTLLPEVITANNKKME